MIHIALFGTKTDYDACVSLLDELPELQFRQFRCTHLESYDDFIGHLPVEDFCVIFVLADGAAGMEAVMAAKTLAPRSAVIWLTDDEDFGAQSYRLGCTYFAKKPITGPMLSLAMQKYHARHIALS